MDTTILRTRYLLNSIIGSVLALLMLAYSPLGLANWLDADREQVLTQHAEQAPRSAERSVQGLANYLAGPARDDYETAYVLYRWVTGNISYDVKAFRSGIYGDQSAEGALHNRRGVCSGYANLMLALGQAANLDMRLVTGFAKGASYIMDEPITGDSNHAWNAVRIGQQWHLLDSTWGAGNVRDLRRFERKYDAFYFLTPPDQLIYSHLPTDNHWQLLQEPVSAAQFAFLPRVRPAFFEHGLVLVSHPGEAIRSDGYVKIILRAAPNTVIRAGLKRADQKLGKQATFVQSNRGEFVVHVALPRRGHYELNIFAGNQVDTGSLAQAMSYSIDATGSWGGDSAFPLAYSQYSTRNVHLESPLQGKLIKARNQRFQLLVPEAQQVAVIVDEQWHYLEKNGDRFDGIVYVDGEDIGVYAKFGDTQSFVGLLGYDAGA